MAETVAFLAAAGWGGVRAAALAGDASGRRYTRLTRGADTAVLMQAPADPEGTRRFADLARWLCGAGFSAPRILAGAEGLLLLEDLGDDLFARVLAAGRADETVLYSAAIDALATLQRLPPPTGLPVWDAARLGALTEPFVTRFAPRAGIDAARAGPVPAAVAALADRILPPPSVTCLRDVHAENLIWLPDRGGVAAVGLLDFQDAFVGAPAYDVVSLLYDARRDLPAGLAARMLDRFAAATGADRAGLDAQAALLAAQRNLRILGVFTGLAEAGKGGYLRFVPRVLGHLRQALAHPALAALAETLGPLPEGVGADA